MTRKHLEEWHYLELRAEQLAEQIRELEARALPKSPDWSGKPRSASPDILLDRLVPDIIERQRSLGAKLAAVLEDLSEIEQYVAAIDDSQVRVIIFYRCRERLKWTEIAERVGGHNTEYSVKQRYYRFFEKY